MKEGIINTWNKINEIGNKEVSLEGTKELLAKGMSSILGNSHEKEIAKMAKMDPHSEVKPMLVDALSALEADMVQAA